METFWLIKASRIRWFHLLWYNKIFKNSSSSQWGLWGSERRFYLTETSHNGRQQTSLISEERKKSWGLHLCISTFLYFSFFSHLLPVCCPSIFFLSPHHSCLSSPLCHLSLSPSLSWCKVMKADACRSGSARLRDYAASHMKDSWCSQGFVSVYVCVFGEGTGKKGTRRVRGKKEREWGIRV